MNTPRDYTIFDRTPSPLHRAIHRLTDLCLIGIDRTIAASQALWLAALRLIDRSIALAAPMLLASLGLIIGGVWLLASSRPFGALALALGLIVPSILAIRALVRWQHDRHARQSVLQIEWPQEPIDGISSEMFDLDEEIRHRVGEVKSGNQAVVARSDNGRWVAVSATQGPGVYLVALGSSLAPRLLVHKVCAYARAFYREAFALYRLRHLDGVVSLLGIDPAHNTLVLEAIAGKSVEAVRVAHLDQSVPATERPAKAQQVSAVLDDSVIDSVWQTLNAIHRAGVCMVDLHYSNILLRSETSRPVFVDFGQAKFANDHRSLAFFHRRSQECRRFHSLFGDRYMDPERLREGVQDFIRERENLPWYSGVNFGNGLVAGNIGSRESGRRKWEFILEKHLEPLAGSRVLDLGCNNGNISFQALFAGASEVVGVELDPYYYRQAGFVKSAYEWMHLENYAFQRHNMSIMDLDADALGHFDVTFCLNCLYYLSEDELEVTLGRLRGMTTKLLVQCNTSGQFSKPETNHRSSVEYNCRHLEKAGFVIETLEAPRFYYRPLVVARSPEIIGRSS